MIRVVIIFGTRPEVIKLAPVIRALESEPARFHTCNVATAQHMDLLYPFLERFGLRVDHDLAVMRPGQSPAEVCRRVLEGLEPVLAHEAPNLVLVQGDTTTALAGALAGFYGGIPVGHVEAGLRSGDRENPFPEEINRQLISRLATYHFAATTLNRQTLLAEGVPPDRIAVTGNPVVDTLHAVISGPGSAPRIERQVASLTGLKLVVLTTHRRESFGAIMRGHLRALRDFVDRHADVGLAFPVHPNPRVREAAEAILGGRPRVCLLSPLDYDDFVHLMSRAWLIVSDSGGVQEEAPSLGRPLLVLRENTERPEAIQAGIARLVGASPQRLSELLEEAYAEGSWIADVQQIENPYGAGDSGPRIAQAIARWLEGEVAPTAERAG